jgi:hypothetical protein
LTGTFDYRMQLAQAGNQVTGSRNKKSLTKFFRRPALGA